MPTGASGEPRQLVVELRPLTGDSTPHETAHQRTLGGSEARRGGFRVLCRFYSCASLESTTCERRDPSVVMIWRVQRLSDGRQRLVRGTSVDGLRSRGIASEAIPGT